MAEKPRNLIRFRLTSSVIRKITKLHFGPLYGGIMGNTSALYVTEFHSENASFTRKTAS